MSALTIVQAVAGRLALPVPGALFSATDAQAVQLRSLLNDALVEHVTWPDHAWTKLTKEVTFTTIASNTQSAGAVPSDLDRFCDDSIWDRTTNRPLTGPITPQQWQQEMAGPTFTSMYLAFRVRGASLLITPVPAAGHTVAYEYVSNLAVYGGGGATLNQSAFTADADTSIFDETLMARALRWCFLRAKGLDYSQEYAQWVEMLQRFAARDGGMPKLSASSNGQRPRLAPYVPDGNW